MESLHLSFQRVVDAGLFQGINIGEGLVNISHMFYADDAVFVGQWCDRNISTLVHVLECFHKVSGLRINMCKSKIMGVHVDEKLVRCAPNQLGCLTLNVPFSYLGSIVGGCMTRQQAWSDIVDRVKKRLSKWKMQMLSIGGSPNVVVPNVLLRNPQKILKVLSKMENKASWVNWKHVLKSKETGGLGVSSLYAINRGLLVKWIWRFFSQGNSLWPVNYKAIKHSNGLIGTTLRKGYKSCWTSIIREMESLSKHGINVMQYMHIKLGDEESSKFWYGNWCEDGVLKDRYPRVYALESCKNVTVANETKADSSKDRWTWKLEKSGEFSVAPIMKPNDDKNDYLSRIYITKMEQIFPNEVLTVHSNGNGVGIPAIYFLVSNGFRDVSKLLHAGGMCPFEALRLYDDWLEWIDSVRLPKKNKQNC
ncbi:hypothetical protein Tco_0466306 [Tanacetum coccineum]